MTEEEVKTLLEQVRMVARQEAQNVMNKCVQVVPATIVSVSGATAIVRLSTATDNTKDFSVPVTTSQAVAVGNNVNVAYWSNLSTGILLSK